MPSVPRLFVGQDQPAQIKTHTGEHVSVCTLLNEEELVCYVGACLSITGEYSECVGVYLCKQFFEVCADEGGNLVSRLAGEISLLSHSSNKQYDQHHHHTNSNAPLHSSPHLEREM